MLEVLLSARQSWLEYWGLCVCVCALPVPPQCWLGSDVRWFGPGLKLLPAILGWSLWCVRSDMDFGFSPPILARLSASVCLCVQCA